MEKKQSSNPVNERAWRLGNDHRLMGMTWGKAFSEAKKFGYTGLRACIFADAAAA